jgi:large subunit ribosomal protein L4e
LARGHRIEGVDEIPLVISASLENSHKTKKAVAFLKAVKAYADVQKVSQVERVY